jgi:hypothetical protein
MGTIFRCSKSIVVLSCWFDFLFLLSRLHWQAARAMVAIQQGTLNGGGQRAGAQTSAFGGNEQRAIGADQASALEQVQLTLSC